MTNSMFSYIIKEKPKKNLIVLSSDEEDEDILSFNVDHENHQNLRPTKLRKLEGSKDAPIALDDSDDDEEVINNNVDLTVDDEKENQDQTSNQQLQIKHEMMNDLPALYPTSSQSFITDSKSIELKQEQYATSSQTVLPIKDEVIRENLHESLASNNIEELPFIPSSLSEPVPVTSPSPQLRNIPLSNTEANSIPAPTAIAENELITDTMNLEITTEPMELDEEQQMIIDTFIPPNTEKIELLRMMEVYLQSVTEPSVPIPTSNALLETPRTRRTRSRDKLPNNSRQLKDCQSPSLSNIHQVSDTPYVPTCVWYNSNWEDWAQLDVADILHYPFQPYEVEIIKNCVSKQVTKRAKIGRDMVDFWQYVSTLLPGRTPTECRYFWADYLEGNHQMFNKAIIVRRHKARPRYRSRCEVKAKCSIVGRMNTTAMKDILLANMKREQKINQGSGDAISLAIFKDPAKGIRLAIGSVCDENVQYNLPGNLRLWTSKTNDCKLLKGHRTGNTTENSTDSPAIWRTVTDVKMSKDQTLIYSASHDGIANIWRARDGKLVSTLKYHCKPINQIAVNYACNENVLATCSDDGSATVWRMDRSGKKGSGVACELDLDFYSDPHVDCAEFGHHASSESLFLGINNKDLERPGCVEAYNIVSGRSCTRFDSMKGCVSSLAVSNTGRYIVSGNYNRFDDMSGDKHIHLHDFRIPKNVRTFRSGHADVNVVAISPCERFVASGNADKEQSEVVIFDVRYHQRKLHILSHKQSPEIRSLIAPDSSIGIGGLYWMSNSRTIITGGGDATVKVWSIEGATQLLKTYPTSNCVTSLAVNEETMTVAAGVAGAEGIVHVWHP
ncbi:WD40-repeat-containing domain protein [Cokeromyces recurvatus]|uniref:WD40-repeat-containing domain protein n=1 Tax=Cokeromyces recurvatus TaxID=90255 RepID=UPI00221F4D47|nr:WD40-repeat-containing domain protein [Cokeromyces recurvatus]KAI7899201.1 WD40-repeat-containing domain protein [Cokeromyces recurvatus]